MLVVAITAIISIIAFSNNALTDKLILWPRRMDNPAEYYRLLTSGFIHADWMHLMFNMFTLYSIGLFAEMVLGFGFLTLYLTGIIVASLPSFLKNRNNGYYRSLGASGGVSAVIFFFIYNRPWHKIYLFGTEAFGIAAILFGAIYLGSEIYMSKRGGGNVNHDAHIWGAVYGFLYALITDPSHGQDFLRAIAHPY